MPVRPSSPALVLLALVAGAALAVSEPEGSDHLGKNKDVPVHLRGVSKPMLSSVDDVVDEQINLSGDTEASAPLADDLAYFVRKHYFEQGYLHADAAWALEGKDIVLTVDEGIQQQLGKVTFENNPGLDAQELERYLERPTRERIGRFASKTPYVVSEIAQGRDLVERFLLSQGYADASVDPPVPTRKEDGTTDLVVVLHPGDQWHVGEVTLEGEPPRFTDHMTEEVKALAGQPANEAHIESMRRQIEGEVQTRGYFTAKAAVTTVRGSDRLFNILYTVTPGPLCRVTAINTADTFSKGARRLIHSSFLPSIGHVYDSKRTEAEYAHVLDTGIFERVEMEPTVVGDGEIALDFKGTEAKRSSITISGGYDTFQGAILGVEYKNVNLWDTGDTFSAKATGTQLGLLVGLEWKNPAIFNSPYALVFDVKPETFTFEGYTRHTLGIKAALSRDFTRHLSAEAYIGSSVNTVTSDTLTPTELGPDKYTLGNAGLSVTYEARDNPVSPTRGWYASGTIEGGYISGTSSDNLNPFSSSLNGGGISHDLSYTRTDFALSYYQPLSAKWRTAFGAHLSSIVGGQGLEDIPIELRVYNGGAKGVRSFAERELGPRARQDGTPLGGTQTETISGEISYEIFKNFEVAGFVDVGSLTTGKASLLPRFDDSLRYAAGMGLRYRLPFGPLRIDYGVNLNKKEGDPFGALHIGFGFAF